MLVKPPPALARPGFVWKLNRALHGERRSPRHFQVFLADSLQRIGWTRSLCEPSLEFREDFGYIVEHADDMALIAPKAKIASTNHEIEQVLRIR